MSVSQFEQLDRFEDHDESYDRALLQTAITEAFAFLNPARGKRRLTASNNIRISPRGAMLDAISSA
jgi:hypothetical protein